MVCKRCKDKKKTYQYEGLDALIHKLEALEYNDIGVRIRVNKQYKIRKLTGPYKQLNLEEIH